MARLRIKLTSYNKSLLLHTVRLLQEQFRAASLRCIIAFIRYKDTEIVYNASHHCYAKTNKEYAYLRKAKVVIYIEGQKPLIIKQLNSFKINSEIRADQVSFIG